ncbi:P-loop containing nucleoside triphosphate hydrolase protein [Phlebopus sp. FC_14]|nr:P-loop containing nucleoside triphosphate hydrolase protein [Phlebopus sp. FC_14]
MRLQSLIPTIPQDLVLALETCGIRTDTDLLFCGTSIGVLQRLPPGIVSLADLEKYTSLVAEKASAPGIRGDEELAKELLKNPQHVTDLTCGVDELDALVGGFGSSLAFEVSGDRGSGKTTLALQIVLRLLSSRADVSVLWMDTTGDFSVQRTADMARQLEGEASETALERLEVSLVLNLEIAQDVLEELRASLSNLVLSPRPRCVVVDSVTPLLAPSLSAVSSQGHANMTTFMQHLRFLARTYSLTFLIINDTSSSPPSSAFPWTNRRPALGPSFAFLSDCTLWLAKQESSNGADTGYTTHTAEVFRSRTTYSGTWCTFEIRQGLLYSAN